MGTTANTAALPRTAAKFLVRRIERETGSRMVAYTSVARAAGTTSEWMRKFIRGDEAKEPQWSVGWNLIAHCYEVLCTRVEQEIEAERSLKEELKREIDAATSIINQVVAGAPGAKASGAVAGPYLGKDP
jgi:hypothetical protein